MNIQTPAHDMAHQRPQPQPQPARKKRTPQQQRRLALKLSAILFVLLPSILAGTYYAVVAADQYAVEVRFAVRGAEGSSGSDILGMFTGLSTAGSTVVDSYVLMDYLHSRQILEHLHERINLEEIYNSDRADFLTAFNVASEPIEYFQKYWKSMINVDFDPTTNIIVVEVRTFAPEHSEKLAEAILALSEALVNQLSERSREDALKIARNEVQRMETRLREQLRKMRDFRERNQAIDPAQTVTAQVTQLSALETQLNAEKAQLAAQRAFMNDRAPAIQVTRAKIAALEKQVAAERARLGKGGITSPPQASSTLSEVVEDYQALATELEFSQKAYISALTSLEQARLTASKQQRYLAVFVTPSLPQQALYPNRILNIAIVVILSLCIWAVFVLLAYAIRDHAM